MSQERSRFSFLILLVTHVASGTILGLKCSRVLGYYEWAGRTVRLCQIVASFFFYEGPYAGLIFTDAKLWPLIHDRAVNFQPISSLNLN